MNDRTSGILIILLGLPFLALAVFFLATGVSVIAGGRNHPAVVNTLQENPWDFWRDVLFIGGVGLCLVGAGIRALWRSRERKRR